MKKEAVIKKLAHDIELLREEQYGYIRAGLPRFPAFFGRDSCIASWQLLDYNAGIAKTTLDILMRLQGTKQDAASEEEPGKMPHEWHPNPSAYKFVPWPLPYYGSVDVTPLFIYLAYLYYEKTTDTHWLESAWPHMLRALAWCETYGDFDSDMLLEYERKRFGGLTHQGWKDSLLDHLHIKSPVELVEVQGYYYAGLTAASDCALMLKDETRSNALRKRAEKLKAYFLEQFWLPRDHYFAFALQESREPIRTVTSNPGHLLFTGILGSEHKIRDMLVSRLFSPDMWTPFGIRTHAESDKDFNPMSYHLGSVWPHDNWIIAQGLKRCGYLAEYERIKQALLAVYEQFGEIPELYAARGSTLERIPVACVPQAWASGALLNVLLE